MSRRLGIRELLMSDARFKGLVLRKDGEHVTTAVEFVGAEIDVL